MELNELALLSRDEIEQEIHRRFPDPKGRSYADELDQAMEKRIDLRETIYRLQVEALLDGKLTVDQVVDQHHNPYSEDWELEDYLNRTILQQALQHFQDGLIDRDEIVDDTVYHLDLV